MPRKFPTKKVSKLLPVVFFVLLRGSLLKKAPIHSTPAAATTAAAGDSGGFPPGLVVAPVALAPRSLVLPAGPLVGPETFLDSLFDSYPSSF